MRKREITEVDLFNFIAFVGMVSILVSVGMLYSTLSSNRASQRQIDKEVAAYKQQIDEEINEAVKKVVQNLPCDDAHTPDELQYCENTRQKWLDNLP